MLSSFFAILQFAPNTCSFMEGIGKNAFSGCKNIEGITIPDGVTSIGENAFVNCPKIRRIGIPDSVLSIGKHAIGYEYNERGKIYLPLGTIIIYGKEGYAGYLYAQETGLRFGEMPTRLRLIAAATDLIASS